VLAAIYRASSPSRTTGTPRDYGLRLLAEPRLAAGPAPLAAALRNHGTLASTPALPEEGLRVTLGLRLARALCPLPKPTPSSRQSPAS